MWGRWPKLQSLARGAQPRRAPPQHPSQRSCRSCMACMSTPHRAARARRPVGVPVQPSFHSPPPAVPPRRSAHTILPKRRTYCSIHWRFCHSNRQSCNFIRGEAHHLPLPTSRALEARADTTALIDLFAVRCSRYALTSAVCPMPRPVVPSISRESASSWKDLTPTYIHALPPPRTPAAQPGMNAKTPQPSTPTCHCSTLLQHSICLCFQAHTSQEAIVLGRFHNRPTPHLPPLLHPSPSLSDSPSVHLPRRSAATPPPQRPQPLTAPPRRR